jgi:hypothetical protein
MMKIFHLGLVMKMIIFSLIILLSLDMVNLAMGLQCHLHLPHLSILLLHPILTHRTSRPWAGTFGSIKEILGLVWSLSMILIRIFKLEQEPEVQNV